MKEKDEILARHLVVIATMKSMTEPERAKAVKRMEDELNAFLARWGVNDLRFKCKRTTHATPDGQHRHGGH